MSPLYVMLGRLVALVLLCFLSQDLKELEIVVLRHELAVLRGRCHAARWRPRTGLSGSGEPAAPPDPPNHRLLTPTDLKVRRQEGIMWAWCAKRRRSI
jgi:hypothetical protein